MTSSWCVNQKLVEFVVGDITRQGVDAIVNAANVRLAVGGGVDGAIHRAGGPSIMAETRDKYPDGCPTGSAVISSAGNLPAKYVIHAVGPIWEGGKSGEPNLLAGAVRSSLQLASDKACNSIAFPAISCGVYGYPITSAAKIAIEVARDWARENTLPTTIQFVLFDDAIYKAFIEAATAILGDV